MNLIAFFSKPIRFEVGDQIRYRGQNGQMYWGKIEKIVDNIAKVKCFVMGSEITQWIALPKCGSLRGWKSSIGMRAAEPNTITNRLSTLREPV